MVAGQAVERGGVAQPDLRIGGPGAETGNGPGLALEALLVRGQRRLEAVDERLQDRIVDADRGGGRWGRRRGGEGGARQNPGERNSPYCRLSTVNCRLRRQ
jgi:hypothetical protein